MSALVAVVDHGAGNLVSIARGLERTGAEVRLAAGPDDLIAAEGIVLPGVGATATVMDGIRRAGLEEALRETEAPILGICVGMQVLFDRSGEDGADCLGLIGGTVERLEAAPTLPHIGWNEISIRPDPIFEGVDPGAEVYFVHSYAPVPSEDDVVIATATHGSRFVAAVRRGRVVGTQFHPERSGTVGLRILDNFVASIVGVRA